MQILIVSLTVFAIFFGAGNLIYPIFVGAFVQDHFAYGILGFVLTGVFVPLIGLIAMIKSNCDTKAFFSTLGKKGQGTILVAIIMLVLGPIGGIPRCFIVPFESLQLLTTNIDFIYFNIGFGMLSLSLALKKGDLVNLIGKYITPLLIICIIFTIVKGLAADINMPMSSSNGSAAFTFAAIEGFQTMDLCAALFFAKIVLDYFKDRQQNKSSCYSIVSSIIGMLLLSIVYVALLFLGAKYSVQLSDAHKGGLFTSLAQSILGREATFVIISTVFFACLTTVVALIDLVSTWASKKSKLSYTTCTILVTILSVFSASLGLESLSTIFVHILWYLYPGLVILSALTLISFYVPQVKCCIYYAFWLTLFLMLLFHLNLGTLGIY